MTLRQQDHRGIVVVVSFLHRYEAGALCPITNTAARRFLAETGLPREHMLFTPEEPTTVTGDDLGFELRLVVVGAAGDRWATSGGGVYYCVEVDYGRVVLLGDDREVIHVNVSPAAFLACLQEFAAGLPYGTVDSELEELVRQAQRLADTLAAIDDSALLDDRGETFWLDVVNEVRVGEYTANRR